MHQSLTLSAIDTTTHRWNGSSPHVQGSLSLKSPTESSARKANNKGHAKASSEKNIHAYRCPTSTDSRSPCPALNTLANHGYIPRDGKNITVDQLIAALEHPDAYNLSSPLAKLLVKGGEGLMDGHELLEEISLGVTALREILFKEHDSLSTLHGMYMKCGSPLELGKLAEHGAIEHNASIAHKNAARGCPFAPTRTDTVLLNDFIDDHKTLALPDIARRRVELERAAPLDDLHAEIARGEWALVLEIFGKAHGGNIPTAFLREWIYENRFPEGWHPDHQQGLLDTVQTSAKIRAAMTEMKKNHVGENKADIARWAAELLTKPEEATREERGL